jgi:hypothetical protein
MRRDLIERVGSSEVLNYALPGHLKLRSTGGISPPATNTIKRKKGRRYTPSKVWSGRRDLNPRQLAWEARTLPLSYSRPLSCSISGNGGSTTGARRPAPPVVNGLRRGVDEAHLLWMTRGILLCGTRQVKGGKCRELMADSS